MIANDEQLRGAQEQVGAPETAMRSMTVTLCPESEGRFHFYGWSVSRPPPPAMAGDRRLRRHCRRGRGGIAWLTLTAAERVQSPPAPDRL